MQQADPQSSTVPASGHFRRLAVCLLGLLPVGTSLWSQQMFGEVSFEQFIYHLRFGRQGLLKTDTDSIESFFLTGVLLPIGAALLVTLLLWMADRWLSGGKASQILRRNGHWLIMLTGIVLFLAHFSFDDYLESLIGPDVFSAHYIKPDSVQLTSNGRPRNLVIIYVESLEGTYQDSSRFGRDLLEPLTRMQQRYTSFAHYPQSKGAHWTIAGIVSTQCGVPLKVALLPSPDDPRVHLRQFLPGALCLGDVLRQHGYENVFMNGPDLEFADMGLFLRNHGYDRVYGAKEWIDAGEPATRMRAWGLRDDRLLARARTELDGLMAAGKPFNLTILTVDTHGPKGLMSDECRRRGARDFPDIVTCTAGQVAEFINYIETRGWLDRIAVLVQGDHIAMENPIHDTLEGSANRVIFNMIATRPAELPLGNEITHFDMYPTLLELAGLHPEGGRMALGWCLLQRCNTPAPPVDRIAQFKEGLLNRSPTYETLWLPRTAP